MKLNENVNKLGEVKESQIFVINNVHYLKIKEGNRVGKFKPNCKCISTCELFYAADDVVVDGVFEDASREN